MIVEVEKDKNIGMADVYFSIVIPLYNMEKEIARTLESVFAQTYRNFEIIIVDDGSTDESVRVVESMTPPCPSPSREGNKNPFWHSSSREGIPIRVVEQENGGVSAARNRGIEEAKYDYIALLDADDEWKPEYLETQVKLIKKYPEASVFVTNYEFKNEKGEVKPTIIKKLPFKEEDGILSNYFKVASCSHPPLWTSAVIAKKEVLQSVGGFPLGIKSGEDLLTWGRLACRYKIAFSKKSNSIYFVPSSGTYRIDPKDMSLKNDKVRLELKKLFNQYHPCFYKKYLSFWDKMRSVINLRKLDKKETRLYAMESIKENPLNFQAVVILLLSFFPNFIIKSIFNKR